MTRPHCEKCSATILGGSSVLVEVTAPSAERSARILCQDCGDLVVRWLTTRVRLHVDRLEPAGSH
jgi:hypothetical protein